MKHKMVSLVSKALFFRTASVKMIGRLVVSTLLILTQSWVATHASPGDYFRMDTSRTLDSLGLVALYEATDGPNWVDPWDLNAAINNWKGISIFQDRVTTLVLKNKNLTGTIPAELGLMDKLSIVDLRENGLIGSIPEEIGNMTSLRSLSLFRNNLSGTLPASLGNLKELHTLSAFENAIQGPLPAELGSATKLELVDLHDNQLTGEIPAAWFDLKLLRTLNLGMNQLEGEVPASLGNAENLESLWLFENQLSGSLPISMNNLLRLKNVFLHRNALTGMPEDLSALDSIRNFSVFENELKNLSDLSHITEWDRTNNSAGLLARDNHLTFDDLLLNQSEFLSRGLAAAYMPQGLIELDYDTVFLSKGDVDMIDLGFDDAVTDNQFVWLKGNDTIHVNNESRWMIDSVDETLEGEYHVMVSNGTFAGMTLQTSSFYIDVSTQTTAGSDFSNPEHIRIFPNPALESKILLHANEPLEGTIFLYDQWGALNHNQDMELRKGSNSINLTDALVPGMYYVIFRHDATIHRLGKWILMP